MSGLIFARANVIVQDLGIAVVPTPIQLEWQQAGVGMSKTIVVVVGRFVTIGETEM